MTDPVFENNALNLTEKQIDALFDVLHFARSRMENGAELHKCFDWAEAELQEVILSGINPNCEE